MSREILFRGKDESGILNHQWQFGALDNTDEKFPKIIRLDRWGNKMIVNVTPETVGQFTGLTDKNGKKIFEGDIVKREFTLHHGETKKTRETQIGVVGFKRGEFMANVVKGRGTWFGIGIVWKGDYLEIIGNIHDNPELLTAAGADQKAN